MSSRRDKSFFDAYPQEYDMLTNASERIKTHRREVQAIINKFAPKAVLDAGCGSGLTARLFAARSIPTLGLDRSKAMVEMAKTSNLLYSKLLTFRLGHFERLPENLRGRFDLVVCLANSISGTGSHANLHRALKGFYSVLQPDGSLVLQMLNYSAIKEGEIVPVRATQGGSIIYERFTERRARRLYLYVTRLNLKCKPPQLEVFRQEMDNFDLSEIVTGLKKAGFINIKRYADLYLSARFTRFSRDLVITARKAVR